MKIDEKRIKKFAGSALLTTALVLGGTIAINEYTVNHNDRICLLTRIIGYQHQIEKIDTDKDNIRDGIFAEYSEIYYESPKDDYSIHYKDHKAYLNDNINNKSMESAPFVEPYVRFIPNIEIYKRVDMNDFNDAILIKKLKLKQKLDRKKNLRWKILVLSITV